MTIYTVSIQYDHHKFGTNHFVVGSYTTRGRALDECVDYIIDRIRNSADISYCVAHDENHLEAAQFFSEGKDGRWKVRRGRKKALREHIRDALCCDCCYYVATDYGLGQWATYHFDIDENDVEGEMWHTVTWGDSDVEDPEFTTPWTELFTYEDDAIESFVNYAKSLMSGHEMKIPDDLYAVVKKQLNADGRAQVDLSDGCSVSCVMYHDDAKNIK